MNSSIVVTAQEVTDKLASEIGILTVNNFMQAIQIEKMHAKIETDEQNTSRLNNMIVSQNAEIVRLSKEVDILTTKKKLVK